LLLLDKTHNLLISDEKLLLDIELQKTGNLSMFSYSVSLCRKTDSIELVAYTTAFMHQCR